MCERMGHHHVLATSHLRKSSEDSMLERGREEGGRREGGREEREGEGGGREGGGREEGEEGREIYCTNSISHTNFKLATKKSKYLLSLFPSG